MFAYFFHYRDALCQLAYNRRPISVFPVDNMIKKSLSRNQLQNFARRWHRRLGVIVGIQFLFWTISGTYFAWFHIENVRGNHDKNAMIEVLLEKQKR